MPVKVAVKVASYGAKLVTFVPSTRCYVKVTLNDFIRVTSDVIFLDKPTVDNTASEIMGKKGASGHNMTPED
jgi:hypothetical protein